MTAILAFPIDRLQSAGAIVEGRETFAITIQALSMDGEPLLCEIERIQKLEQARQLTRSGPWHNTIYRAMGLNDLGQATFAVAGGR